MKRYKKSKAIAIGVSVFLGIITTVYVGVSIGSGSWNPAEWVPEKQVEEQLPDETPSDETPGDSTTDDGTEENQ